MGISLAEVGAELPPELYAAQDEGAPAEFRFEVEPAELSLEVESRRDGNGVVKVEVALPGSRPACRPVAGRAVPTVGAHFGFRVRDEAHGGERVRIRRPAGGLDARDSADTVVDGSPTASIDREPRPWES
ncbi:trypco2 family protein [Streptomyces sp. NPDC056361]|uniref:trypco2 family protein n=1 Tax=Streptomyces sp. NPDC056361 TaxID=3345795 RepID=UPI0035DCDA42